jgi:hypothetical protein
MNQPSRRHHRYTFADYLTCEDGSNVKHEFFEGEIYAMAGGTPEHAALAAAVTTVIGAQLGEGPCRAFSSDLKIACGPPAWSATPTSPSYAVRWSTIRRVGRWS